MPINVTPEIELTHADNYNCQQNVFIKRIILVTITLSAYLNVLNKNSFVIILNSKFPNVIFNN